MVANCRSATLLPVKLLMVMKVTLREISKGLLPFCVRRPKITVQSEAWGWLEKHSASLMTKFSATSVPPQICVPFLCRLAIHGHVPADTTELPPPTTEVNEALPHTTAGRDKQKIGDTELKNLLSHFCDSIMIWYRYNHHKSVR